MGSPGKPLGASAAALHGRGGQSLDIVQIALRISRADRGGRGCRQNRERYQQEEHAFQQSTPAPGGLKRGDYIEHRLGYELNEMVCAESWAVNGESFPMQDEPEAGGLFPIQDEPEGVRHADD